MSLFINITCIIWKQIPTSNEQFKEPLIVIEKVDRLNNDAMKTPMRCLYSYLIIMMVCVINEYN